MEHDHSHQTDLRTESKSRLMLVLVFTSVYLVLVSIASVYTKSLALLADAGHVVSDLGSLLLALLAIWFAQRPASAIKTYGYYRSEILAGLTNGVVLIGLSLFILFEAYRRLNNPPEILTLPMLCVALAGLVLNFLSMRVLGGHAGHSLNVKAAYLEVLGDLLASLGLVFGSLVMMFTRWYALDAIISAVIGILILPRTWLLLSDCTNILMEGAPGHIDLVALRNAMLAVPGVVDVHDIHVWTITQGMDAMSGHVTIDQEISAEGVLSEMTRIAQDDFHLNHTTIQVEQVECKSPGSEACK